MLVNIHQDIDEQYARRLRPGTRLELLDPALLIGMFQQYQLGMRAAKLRRTCTSTENVEAPKNMGFDNWVGLPCWVPQNCLLVPANISLALMRIKGLTSSELLGCFTWTLHHYRAFAHHIGHNRIELYWFDADENIVAMDRICEGSFEFIVGGMAAHMTRSGAEIYNLYFV